MANRFFNPNEQFSDATGLPYAGGTLAFYASGTSTPLNTYSDSALTIANTNPVVLDSAGRPLNTAIFLQNLAYKVTLSDVNSNLIWTEDPVFSSDYSTRAKLTSGAGSPNGSVAGTAGSTGIGADTYWDNVNNILYVCTTTGNAASAVWTAVNATAAAAVVPAPQGYLTPTSGTPIIPADVISSASLVYTPYVGNLVPVFNGTGFSPLVFSELTLTLTAANAASTLYDVFVFNNAGVLTLVTGPAWTNSSAGVGARGTGAGTSQISRLSGLWVNTVQITGKNGANTYVIPANQATYLGSIFIDLSPGQITLHRSYGQSRKWGIWNAYNRVPIILRAGDSTASWTYSGNIGPRPAENNNTNTLTTFCGLAEEDFQVFYRILAECSGTGSGAGGYTVSAEAFGGIGVNSTSVFSVSSIVELSQAITTTGFTSAAFFTVAPIVTSLTSLPTVGINVYTALEQTIFGTAGSIVYFGTENQMLLSANYRA